MNLFYGFYDILQFLLEDTGWKFLFFFFKNNYAIGNTMVSKNVKRKLGAVKKLTKIILFSYYYKGQNWCTVFVNIPYVIQEID